MPLHLEPVPEATCWQQLGSSIDPSAREGCSSCPSLLLLHPILLFPYLPSLLLVPFLSLAHLRLPASVDAVCILASGRPHCKQWGGQHAAPVEGQQLTMGAPLISPLSLNYQPADLWQSEAAQYLPWKWECSVSFITGHDVSSSCF